MLQWARSQGCPWDKRTCAYAAYDGGHLEILQWLRSQDCPRNERNVPMLLKEAIWRCCNGPEAKAVPGMRNERKQC